MLRTVCDIPKDRLWRCDVFGHILQSLGHVSFASVKSDVIHLIPRDEGWALTAEDLTDPKFHYLRKTLKLNRLDGTVTKCRGSASAIASLPPPPSSFAVTAATP